MKQKLLKLLKYPLPVLFIFLLCTLSLLDIFWPEREYSELENRNLAQRPNLTWKGLMDLSFGEDYEEYLTDQFVFRDGWISMKSLLTACTGMTENNGVLYGKDGYLFEKLFSCDEQKIEKNIGYLDTFAENCPYPLSVMMIPNSYEVYSELLPLGAENVSQSDYFDTIRESLPEGTEWVDVLNPLLESEVPDLYYRTDHHWTTDGAYVAYTALCESWGLTPCERGEAVEVENFYGTYYSKCKGLGIQPDTIRYYPMANREMSVRTVSSDGDPIWTEYDSLYNTAQFEEYDKYAAFLYSNNDLTLIRNTDPSPEAAGKKLCVLKDSYANSFLPYLTENFEEIAVIDIRYFSETLSEYLAENSFDRVLVMYNFSTFNTENIARISY